MSVSVIVGEMGMGKTSLVRHHLKISKAKRKIYTFKPKDYIEWDKDIIARVPSQFRKVYKPASLKWRNTIAVIDEGATVIKHTEPKEDDPIIQFLSASREANNFVYIVFHALRQVPLWLLPYCHVFIRFNTTEQINIQANRFSAFEKVYNNLSTVPKVEPHRYYELPLR